MIEKIERATNREDFERLFITLERFRLIVLHCFDNREFVKQFDRLTSSNILGRGSAIDLMIDEAAGRFDKDAQKFIEFVHDTVWIRCHALHNESSWKD